MWLDQFLYLSYLIYTNLLYYGSLHVLAYILIVLYFSFLQLSRHHFRCKMTCLFSSFYYSRKRHLTQKKPRLSCWTVHVLSWLWTAPLKRPPCGKLFWAGQLHISNPPLWLAEEPIKAPTHTCVQVNQTKKLMLTENACFSPQKKLVIKVSKLWKYKLSQWLLP